MRAVVSSVLIDGMDPAKGEKLRDDAIGAIEELADFGPLVKPAFGPHAIYTVSPESLRWLAETAAERELALNIHLSETKQEVDDCVTTHGKRPAHHLDELGFLGPAHDPRARRLARPLRAGADRRARRHRRQQPRREHEAGRRRRLPLPRGGGGRSRRWASAPTASPPTTASTCSRR